MQKASDYHPDSRITLTEAASVVDLLTGVRPQSSTVWRWALKGARGRKLKVIRIGGVHYTTYGSVEEFLADPPAGPGRQPEQSRNASPPMPSSPARVSAESSVIAERRRREQQAARDHLDRVCSPKRPRRRAK